MAETVDGDAERDLLGDWRRREGNGYGGAVRQRQQRWDGGGNDGGGGNNSGNNGRQGKCDSYLGGSGSGPSGLGLGAAAAERQSRGNSSIRG